MQAVGAATFWMNEPERVSPLELRRIPLAAALLWFAAGELLARRCHLLWPLLIALVLLLSLTIFALRRAPRIALAPALAISLVVGCWCAQMQPPIAAQQALRSYADGLSREVQGTVMRVRTLPPPAVATDAPQPEAEDDPWELDPEPVRMSVDLDVQAVEFVSPDLSAMQPVHGGLRLLLSGAPLTLRCGETLRMPLRMREPDENRVPGAFSYRDELLTEGIGVLATANASRITIVPAPLHASLRCRLYAAQRWASARLSSYVASHANRALPHALQLTNEDATLLNAMLFGDRTHLTRALRIGFERTGTFHLFVVSGLHVALLASILVWLLRRLGLPEGAVVGIAITLTTAYTMLTGFGVPAQRALLITALFLTARWLDRRITALNALAGAALLVLALDPRALYEAGFQMTFLVVFAVAGLAVPVLERTVRPTQRALDWMEIFALDATLHPRLAQRRVRMRMAMQLSAGLFGPRLANLPLWLARGVLHLAEAAIVSIMAELCMVLPMALYFHRATLVALPLNILNIPLLTVLLCVAIVLFLAMLLGAWVAVVPAAMTALLLHAMRASVARAQHATLGDLRVPSPAAVAIVAACAAMLLAAVLLRCRSRWRIAAGLLCTACIPVAVLLPERPILVPGMLEVTALDVGQGDTIFVASPIGGTMLIDAGGPVGRGAATPTSSFDIGEEVVAPYLWLRHLRRLDVVVLTHAHSDHMGGMPAVLRDLRPRELWLSIEPAHAPGLLALLAEAQSLGIRVRHLQAGEQFAWSGLTTTVLAPEAGYANPGTPNNDDSLVLRLDDQRASVLLEGDAERSSEDTMLARGRLAPVTLLKVGHHGSLTSTNPEFLAAVQPRDAVISVGRHNTFGHPRSEVLGALEAAHVRTFRTDRMGTETFLLQPDGEIRSQSTAQWW
jgi:competence protein ComEC